MYLERVQPVRLADQVTPSERPQRIHLEHLQILHSEDPQIQHSEQLPIIHLQLQIRRSEQIPPPTHSEIHFHQRQQVHSIILGAVGLRLRKQMFKQQMKERKRNLMIATSDYLRLQMFGSDRQIGGE